MGNCCGPNDCGPAYGGRRYYTKEERTEWLDGYAKELENELTAVRERLERIRKE